MKKFKAESQRILDLMINSIYTNKEIFLRELISNASDAIDKLHFVSLTDADAAKDFKIEIKTDDESRTMTISDNGIGMDDKDLEQNLGTIASSGTLKFMSENKPDESLIGRFGVGFYSAFMVAKKVTVITKKYGSDKAYKWESEGAEGYAVSDTEKESCGTEITLVLKDDDDDYTYSDFLNEYFLKNLVKKYSDYIRYPIVMELTKSRQKKDSEKDKPEYESYTEKETVNSMIPIWKRRKQDVTEQEYAEFIAGKFFEADEPLLIIPMSVEGMVSYNALVFIPKEAPVGFFTKEFEKGLQLYSNGVLVMDKCPDLLPEYLGFVRGIVDSDDLSLNISRELLQKDRQLTGIAKSIEKKLVRRLDELMQSDREKYEKIFDVYGVSLKFGLYNNYGEKKNELKDLMLFYSSTEKKKVTLREYTSRKKEDQSFIFYACGRSIESIDKLPQAELIREKGYEMLYLTDHVDEFLMKVLAEYDGMKFKSASDKDLNLDSELKENAGKQEKEHSKMLEEMAKLLSGRVKAVRLSHRLKNNAVCLTADGELSLEMERVLKAIEGNDKIKAERILELNPNHELFEKLVSFYTGDKNLLKIFTIVLYNEALLLEGLNIDNSEEFATALMDMMKQIG